MEEREQGFRRGGRHETSSFFVHNVRAILERSGMSQANLAEQVGRSPSYLSRILNARIEPSLGFSCEIANALDIEIGELLSTEKLDSWLAERLPLFAEVLEQEEIARGMPTGTKRELIRLYHRVIAIKGSAPLGAEFHLLEALPLQDKWTLRSVIEELEELGIIKTPDLAEGVNQSSSKFE